MYYPDSDLENLTECAGNRFGPESLAWDKFFQDLVCGFGYLVFKEYRRSAGTTEPKAHESGLYSVLPVIARGFRGGYEACRCPCPQQAHPPDECPRLMGGDIVRNVRSGNLAVMACPDRRRCSVKHNHRCVDVEKVVRQYMYWFVEWRAILHRPIPPAMDEALTSIFRLHSQKCGDDDGISDSLDWRWRRNAVWNLIHEIRNPLACRPGFIKPENGEPLKVPWAKGDHWVHGLLNWQNKSDVDIMRELRANMQDAMRERLLRQDDPEDLPILWNMNFREKPDTEELRDRFVSPGSVFSRRPKRTRLDFGEENDGRPEAQPSAKLARYRR